MKCLKVCQVFFISLTLLLVLSEANTCSPRKFLIETMRPIRVLCVQWIPYEKWLRAFMLWHQLLIAIFLCSLVPYHHDTIQEWMNVEETAIDPVESGKRDSSVSG